MTDTDNVVPLVQPEPHGKLGQLALAALCQAAGHPNPHMHAAELLSRAVQEVVQDALNSGAFPDLAG